MEAALRLLVWAGFVAGASVAIAIVVAVLFGGL